MKPRDESDREETVTLLPPLPAGVANDLRKERRCSAELPLRLTSGSGETIPAVIRNLGAGGLLATADVRFSLLLPPPNGSCFAGEFFLDDVEARDVLLEIVRVHKQGQHLIELGCQFVQPPPPLTAAIRARVASRLAPLHRA